METLTQPELLLKPFADEGDKNTIPDVNTDTSNPQNADLTNGFPEITSIDPDDGGIPAERKDFNALGYLTTLYDYFYQAGGTFTFNATISTALGGYPLNARLWYTNEDGISMILRSTIGNNTNNFLTDPSVIGNIGDFTKPWVVENFMGIKGQYNLFDFKWCDYEIDDMNWLCANTFSWQPGTAYVTAYNHLEDDIDGITASTEVIAGNTITYYEAEDGHKIVLADQESTVVSIYNTTGVAWYYILDTVNKRFKLPRTKFGFTGLRDTVGKYVEAGLPNITGSTPREAITGKGNTATDGAITYTRVTGDNVSGSGSTWYRGTISFNASNSNSIYGNSTTVQPPATQMYLYFYVGQFSQLAVEQTAGFNSEMFNNKLDIDVVNATQQTKTSIINWIMPKYSDGTSFTSGTTTTKSGWLKLRHLEYKNAWVTVNGVNVYNHQWSGGDYGTQYQVSYMPIGAGETVAYGEMESVKFYPCIGA